MLTFLSLRLALLDSTAHLRRPATLRFAQSAATIHAPAPPAALKNTYPSRHLPSLSTLGLTPAQFVASHCLTHKGLKEYAAWQGFAADLRQGDFTLQELSQLYAAVELESSKRGKEPQNIVHLKNGEDGLDMRPFWTAVSSSVPMRGQPSVRSHVRLKYTLARSKGPWTGEDDRRLFDFVAVNGTAWVLLSKELGRTSKGCSDRWRSLHYLESTTRSGVWTGEEEERLDAALKHLGAKSEGRQTVGFWPAVAKLVKTRTARQCSGQFSRRDLIIYSTRGGQIACGLIDAINAQGVKQRNKIIWDEISIPVPVKRATSRQTSRYSHPTARSLHDTWERLILEPTNEGILDHAGAQTIFRV
ncbi:hypothetical protein P7C70_g2655, partial [Phenoliferia sp. Uapishka_3]